MSPGGPVAVTGATGFLGSHICDALLHAGLEVRAVVRRPDRAGRQRAQGIAVAEADLAHREALEAGLTGCSALVANAALGSWQGPLERYLEVNVAGTERLLRAAHAVGLRRVVLVSTVAVYRTKLRTVMDEDTELYGHERRRLNPSDLSTDWRYALSKSRAEARAWALAGELGLQLTVLRPGPIFGPRDPKFTRRVLAMHARRLVFVPTVGIPMVAARDCADTVPAALQRPESSGRAYNLTGPPASMVDMLAELRRLTGRGPTVVPLPVPLWVAYDTRRAEQELGFLSRPLAETMAEVAAEPTPAPTA